MLEVSIMIEGQNGLNWDRWMRIAETVEDTGYAGLYRSDHFTNANPPHKDSLELWVSLTWLASHTSRISFGPLVTPFSFRHPAFTARMAAAVDDLSKGRLILGMGAGWQELEHNTFGFDLLGISERFNRFEEGLEVVTALLNSEKPVDFSGQYYRLSSAILLPRPQRPAGPPILIGGNGEKRTLPLAAKYAQEWNALFISPAEFSRLNDQLNTLIEGQGRKTSDVKRSMMTGCIFGETNSVVEQNTAARTQGKFSPQQLRERGRIVGTAAEIKEQLEHFSETGLDSIMLQWIDLDDMDGIRTLADTLFS
jgi:F420-dependent oxidoreductase-like protein